MPHEALSPADDAAQLRANVARGARRRRRRIAATVLVVGAVAGSGLNVYSAVVTTATGGGVGEAGWTGVWIGTVMALCLAVIAAIVLVRSAR